jgi:hypothetical protein
LNGEDRFRSRSCSADLVEVADLDAVAVGIMEIGVSTGECGVTLIGVSPRAARKIKIQQEYASGFVGDHHFPAAWRNGNAC